MFPPVWELRSGMARCNHGHAPKMRGASTLRFGSCPPARGNERQLTRYMLLPWAEDHEVQSIDHSIMLVVGGYQWPIRFKRRGRYQGIRHS